MIKLFFLILFLLVCPYSLKAEEPAADDQEFISNLDAIKNPFENGIPKPVIVAPPPDVIKPVARVRPIHIVPPVITLPHLHVQGVIVGEEIHEAIINEQVVALSGKIKGATVISVTKQGVGLLFKGKKFFLKVD